MNKIFFTVTNDLTYDQRMIRICTSLTNHGYQVTLVGRRLRGSAPLNIQPFNQKRLNCFFTKGKAFYIEFNIRLFFYLIFQKIECICAIDLDTIIPCYCLSSLKKIPRVYDAHELFCEMKEIVTRPGIYSIWKKVEKFSVRKFPYGYTVNQAIADEFKKMYGVQYAIIHNFPVLESFTIPEKTERYILYQGAVNHGRSFETLIPSMTQVECPLFIYGDGNFMEQAKKLVEKNNLANKVFFKGKLPPAELKKVTKRAWVGVTLFENNGMSNYLSLANRFSDYIHAAVPQLCVNYPVYNELNNTYHVAVLLQNIEPDTIAQQLNKLLNDDFLYSTLQSNCLKARETLNWQAEEEKLLAFYKNISEQRG